MPRRTGDRRVHPLHSQFFPHSPSVHTKTGRSQAATRDSPRRPAIRPDVSPPEILSSWRRGSHGPALANAAERSPLDFPGPLDAVNLGATAARRREGASMSPLCIPAKYASVKTRDKSAAWKEVHARKAMSAIGSANRALVEFDAIDTTRRPEAPSSKRGPDAVAVRARHAPFASFDQRAKPGQRSVKD